MSTLLEVIELSKRYAVGAAHSGALQRLRARFSGKPRAPSLLHAVEDVNFNIDAGESVGLVGESGCGKSTLVRLVTRLIDPSAGNIMFAGRSTAVIPARLFARMPQRALIQMVFQDPTDSLNPRYTAFDTIAEPLRLLLGMRERHALAREVATLAELVGLPPELLARFPHQLSGGQKARVGIARAIAVKPRLLVLDEPTSALDVSVQALILRLLADLKARLNMSYLFVSHDLNVVRLLCDRVIVMYLGKIVEAGPAAEIFSHPRHPYTQALVSAIPQIGAATQRPRVRLEGEPLSPIDPAPTVCRFFGRCPRGEARCGETMPLLHQVGPAHTAACHFAEASA
jgi:peptide/nickel transport system ATP-binding protein